MTVTALLCRLIMQVVVPAESTKPKEIEQLQVMKISQIPTTGSF